MAEDTVPRRRKQRSPNYPGLSLEKALERAQQLYDVERRHPAPIPTILQHWGYSSKSSPGLVAIAALKKFGLIQDEGHGEARVARLTDLALSIIEDPRPDSVEKARAIQRAALMPKLHKELWDKYEGGLPSDATIEYYMVREKAFLPESAKQFIRLFRRTIAFAGLDDSATVSEDESETVDEPQHGAGTRDEPFVTSGVNTLIGPPPGQKSYPIPVGDGEDVVVTFSGPVTPEKWETFMTILNAMKGPILSAPKLDDEPSED